LWGTLIGPGRYATADADPASGAFELTELPPGRYTFTLASPRYPYQQLGERELAAGETLDLGTLVLADPARIVVHVHGPAGAPPEGLEVELWTGEGRQTTVPIGLESLSLARSGPAPPGRYEVVLRAPGCASVRRAVELTGSETREIDIQLEAGIDCRFRFEVPRGSPAPRWLSIEFHDPAGSLLLRGHAFDREPTGVLEHSARLAPGRYRVRATTTDPSLSGELEFDVAREGAAPSYSIPLVQ
jgi:hypothetical protein